ncbi:MarR family transcriptional regulator [Methylorubrum populi]|uniref:MarR family transcriptional regulator n=2 Tax=Methylorubrum populi TaxID=223967 RepID=A0A169QEE5_9HYPH|nr:MarR family transcriptional regulator [Methylorubrum populi]
MVADILDDLGPLFLGSRLKRLADRFQADAARVLRDEGLGIQPAQFPLLAALDRYGPLGVNDAAAALGVSQPAVTRTAASLVELGLVEGTRSGADLRQKALSLSPGGRDLMARAKAGLWPRVHAAATDLCAGLSGPLLDQLAALERRLDDVPFESRVRHSKGSDQARSGLAIREYTDELAGCFRDINAEWIEAMFSMEENDRRILSDPRGQILDHGGIILFVEAEDLGIVGTCALMRVDEGCFELTKMAVSERARGRKAGEHLLRAVLDRAVAMGIGTLYLLTNTKCAAAVHLYGKVGFRHDAEVMDRFGRRYARCNVAMRYPL